MNYRLFLLSCSSCDLIDLSRKVFNNVKIPKQRYTYMAGVMLSKINFNESNNHGIAIGVVSNLAKFRIPIVKLCCVHTFEGE